MKARIRGYEPIDGEPEDRHREARTRTRPKASASLGCNAARRDGVLAAVRVMMASMSVSYHMFRAPEAPAPTAMQRMAIRPMTGLMWSGASTRPATCRENHKRHYAAASKKPGNTCARLLPTGETRCHAQELSGGLPITVIISSRQLEGDRRTEHAAQSHRSFKRGGRRAIKETSVDRHLHRVAARQAFAALARSNLDAVGHIVLDHEGGFADRGRAGSVKSAHALGHRLEAVEMIGTVSERPPKP